MEIILSVLAAGLFGFALALRRGGFAQREIDTLANGRAKPWGYYPGECVVNTTARRFVCGNPDVIKAAAESAQKSGDTFHLGRVNETMTDTPVDVSRTEWIETGWFCEVKNGVK